MENKEHDNVIYHLHRHKKFLVVHAIVLLIITIVFLALSINGLDTYASQEQRENKRNKTIESSLDTVSVTTNLSSTSGATTTGLLMFSKDAVINETGSYGEVNNSTFWLSSGGRVNILNKIAKTIQGDLPITDKWYLLYKKSNPIDTDGGLHPQNLLRLVTRITKTNFTQEVYFKLLKQNLSSSPNRNASNGVLFFSRYQDSQNLYYAGVRVDGTVVIKKKKSGVYYTLAQTKVFQGVYDRAINPNLLPINTSMGIRLTTQTIGDKVSLILFLDDGKGAGFVKVLEAIDDGVSNGGGSFLLGGKAGIRGDFFDIEFRDYIIF